MAQNLQLTDTPLFSEYLSLCQAAGYESLFCADKKLGPSDALLVIDMQNDFIPAADKYEGGRFAVPEGDLIPPLCVQLIEETMKSGGMVVATRDYHPVDHVSFLTQGGHFPPHCVQGTKGSMLYPSIALAMAEAMKACEADGSINSRASVAFKGFHSDIDSFGGLPYMSGGEGRIAKKGSLMKDPFTGCNAAPWTGCLLMKCSGMCFDGKWDPDAPPDLLAAYNAANGVADHVLDLTKKLKNCNAKRLVVCGLALDFCVCDTALNARELGFDEVLIILDAARPAHVPGLGTIGSGFLQDPVDILQKWSRAGVKLTTTQALTGCRLNLPPIAPSSSSRGVFPESLGPFGVECESMIRITMDDTMTSFRMTYFGSLKQQIRDFEGGVLGDTGFCTPFAPITLSQQAREKAKIPAAALTFSFAYPVEGVNRVPAEHRTALTAVHNDPNWRFIFYGGFIYFDGQGIVIGANAIGGGEDLRFGAPEKWRSEYTSTMLQEKRFQPVTLSNLKSAGAKWFAWIHAGETLLGPFGTWTPSAHGAFVYLFHDDPSAVSDRDIFFSVVG